jgi:anti-sigma factor RsiW
MITFTKDMFRVLASPCSAHAAHISRRMDGQLSAGQRTGLWVHMRGCASCRAFARQLDKLRTLARAESAASPAPQAMPAPVRERLNATLASAPPDQQTPL